MTRLSSNYTIVILAILVGYTSSKSMSKNSIATDYLKAVQDVDSRTKTILKQLHYNIPIAILSVEADIAEVNRNKAILGMANFLGMVFGIAAGAEGSTNFGQLSTGQKIQVTAQTMYGYGYWGPFLLTFEDARLSCGTYDLDAALQEYGFLIDMSKNFGVLSHYRGHNPRDELTTETDPYLLQYYAVELNHAMKRALYCIVSKKGSNQQALEIDTLIDLYTQLLTERLEMTEEILKIYEKSREL